MQPRPFRSLSVELRKAIKAMGEDERAALNSPLAERIAAGSSYSYRINPGDFLRLCAQLGVDPMAGDPRVANADPGELHSWMIGAGVVIRAYERGLRIEDGGAECGLSRTTLWRLRQNLPTSIETVLTACAFIGVHPFDYMRRDGIRRAA